MGTDRQQRLLVILDGPTYDPRARFSKAPEAFRACKTIAKSRLKGCFSHIFLIWREVSFIQEVSGVNTSLFSDTDELKMA